MQSFDTLSEAMNALKADGFTLDFNAAFDKIQCMENDACLRPEEFEITQVHRFEGMTNPSDQSVLYAIESKQGDLKGLLVGAYGAYSEDMDADMLRKLSIQQ